MLALSLLIDTLNDITMKKLNYVMYHKYKSFTGTVAILVLIDIVIFW